MNQKKSVKTTGQWLAIGIAIGVALGVAFDNIAVGIALGVGLGLLIGSQQQKRTGKDDPSGGD